MKKIIPLLLLLVCLGIKLNAQNNDLRLRMGVELEKEITKKLSIKLGPEIRLESKNELEESMIETGVSYELFDFLDLAAHYRLSYMEGDKTTYHRFAFDAKPKVNIKRLKLRYRLRFTNYTDFDLATKDKSNYTRNRLLLEYDIKNFPVSPYFSGELYYKHSNDDFNKSRYGTGLAVKLNKKVDLDLYYLVQHKHNKDNNERIFGVEFKIEI